MDLKYETQLAQMLVDALSERDMYKRFWNDREALVKQLEKQLAEFHDWQPPADPCSQ